MFPVVEQRLAILHANCQGQPLACALAASPEFARAYSTRVMLNYTREPVQQEELDTCGLFLYQYLGPEWGELSSAALLARLPAGCQHLCIPNMFFRGMWPLWNGAPGFDYRDTLLDHLLGMGLPGRDILHLYLNTSLAKKFDLDMLLAETTARERERETHTPVKYLDYVLEHWRSRPLFFTVNHPGPELLQLAATGILRHLGMNPPGTQPTLELEGYYSAFELPVHPQVAAHYGLNYGVPGSLYRMYSGTAKTFAEYAAAYVECRLAGIDDFISYLHLR